MYNDKTLDKNQAGLMSTVADICYGRSVAALQNNQSDTGLAYAVAHAMITTVLYCDSKTATSVIDRYVENTEAASRAISWDAGDPRYAAFYNQMIDEFAEAKRRATEELTGESGSKLDVALDMLWHLRTAFEHQWRVLNMPEDEDGDDDEDDDDGFEEYVRPTHIEDYDTCNTNYRAAQYDVLYTFSHINEAMLWPSDRSVCDAATGLNIAELDKAWAKCRFPPLVQNDSGTWILPKYESFTPVELLDATELNESSEGDCDA